MTVAHRRRGQWRGARGRISRCAFGAAAATTLVLAGGASAAQAADSLTVELSTANPARGEMLVLHFSGHATRAPIDPPTNGRGPFLRMVVHAGGAPCQASLAADRAANRDDDRHLKNVAAVGSGFAAGQSEGDFTYDVPYYPALGSYRVCAWLGTQDYQADPRENPEDLISATASATFTAKSADRVTYVGPRRAVAGRVTPIRLIAHAGLSTSPGGSYSPPEPELFPYLSGALVPSRGACPAHAEEAFRKRGTFVGAGRPYRVKPTDQTFVGKFAAPAKPGAYRLCFYVSAPFVAPRATRSEVYDIVSLPFTIARRPRPR